MGELEEVWDIIPWFPAYQVSDLGRVRKKDSEKIMAQRSNQYGVVAVSMTDSSGLQRRRSVALMVANAFVPRDRDAFDTPICVNGDRSDCRAVNLLWRPRWFAVKYNRQFRHPYHNPINREICDIATGEIFPNSFEAARAFGLLEKDVVLSIMNYTFTWPTYQQFEMIL